MSKPIRVEDAARNELCAVVAWYEEKQAGLGEEFFAEVERTLELIQRHPDLGSSVPRVPTARGTRRLPLSRFPYTMYTGKRTSNSRLLPSLIIAVNQDTGLLDDKVLILRAKLNVEG